ncbi:hypothetical protein Val02_62630 [Virgisporangium aliadipatigenens]|uniref:Amidoligase enzyme n=1 Tax=Virgisporangium aliadipatigenens TaxID=741659 RepID=A0A8J4DUP8_9ACTN|nr:hypothetical protein [Virgisporangium aliadipatigenens]GIJ49377.1 hypothetical protein Val02_62630 [Virgisporangium aliadipatigenens]
MPHSIGVAEPTDAHQHTNRIDAAHHSQTCAYCAPASVSETPSQVELNCDRCHQDVASNDTIETVRGSTICNDCRSSYRQCEGCDGWNPIERRCANGCCDPYDCDCSDCRPDDDDDDDEDSGGLVHDYDYKPYPDFYGTGPLFLGLEVEIETPYDDGDCASEAIDQLGGVGYLKNDSSIGHGFELVTHPMSYQWAIANFPWRLFPRLDKYGCGTSDSTGMHVHVSRAAFTSPCHAYRWLKFIYRNEHPITLLAGRSSEQWAAFTDDDRRAVKDYAKGAVGARYRAVNTGNSDTFELRIFASTLDPLQIQAALGFAAASVEYTGELTYQTIAHDGGWTWPAFVDWVNARADYAPLAQQMEALTCAC